MIKLLFIMIVFTCVLWGPTRIVTAEEVNKADAVVTLEVEKYLAGGRPKVGAVLVFKIRVENRDPSAQASNIRIEDHLPGGFQYMENTGQ